MIDRRITTGARLSFTVAHVPGVTLRLDREPVAVRTCARLRWRAYGDTTPGSQQARNPASHQSIADAPIGGVIAALSSLGSVLAARSLSKPQRARFWPLAFLQGHAGTLNFRGALQGLLSLFLRKPLVPVSPKTTRGSLKCLFFSPALCSVVAHKRNHAAKEFISVGKSVGVS